MNPLRSFFFCSIVLLSFPVFGQYIHPEKGLVFDDSEVPRVDINIDQDSLDEILAEDNWWNNHEYPATFIFSTASQKDTLENIGFRIRGNSSRSAGKKSFKVSFNTFDRGRKFYGLEKLNLNGEHNDPSIIRSKLCWDLYNWAEVPSSRANHVAFFINDEYKGLYINVEHVDENFIESRLGKSELGNLYKCLYPADLIYKGSNPDLYKEEFWGRRAYDLKTNTAEDDYSDLAHFITVLNTYVGTAFQCELERVFDVDHYLKVIALDILVGNWDGPIANKNNFYLYHDSCTNKFIYFPYDLDNTFGIDWFGIDWGTKNIYTWSELWGEARPIYEKILAVPEYRNRFSFYMKELIETHFNSDSLDTYLNEKRNLLAAYRTDDAYAELDYGFDFVDFLDSYDNGLGDHVVYGLKEYIKIRTNTALQILEESDILPVLKYIDVDWSDTLITFSIEAFDDNLIEQATFHYSMFGEGWESRPLFLDIEGKASIAFPIDQEGDMVYYVELNDNAGQSRSYPKCEDAFVQLGYRTRPAIVINEFLASNLSGNVDEDDEYEDWIELYNAGNHPVELGDLFLSDRVDNPQKWQLPKKTLYPGEYFIAWADEDGEQGDNHANFKLAKEGEFLGLFDGKSNYYAPMDTFTYVEQEQDISFARMPNGTGTFGFADSPTFNANNDFPSSIILIKEKDILLHPNPVQNQLFIQTEDGTSVNISLFDVDGKLLLEKVQTNYLDLSGFSSGIYFVQIDRREWKKIIVQK